MSKMIHFVDFSQTLSQDLLIAAQWAHEQNGHGGRDGGYAWVQPIRLSLIKADLATVTAKSQVPTAESNTEPPVSHHVCSLLLIQTLILDVDLAPHPTGLLPKPPSVELQKTLITIKASTQLCFKSFIVSNLWQWAHVQLIH